MPNSQLQNQEQPLDPKAGFPRLLLAKVNNKQRQKLLVTGAKLLFRNTSESLFDVLTATRPGYFSARSAGNR
jgi:hypothetical protein